MPITAQHHADEPAAVRGIAGELRALSKRLAEMSGLAEAQLDDAVEALETRDVELAARVIAADGEIDDVETEINAKAMAMLTRHAPVAADLREIVAALKISSNVERIGDYAANVAKRTIIISGFSPTPAVVGVIEMGKLVRKYVQTVFDAYTERDVAKAEAVWRGDADIDALHTSVFQELLSDMLSDPDHVPACTHLLFCIKNLERIGDHVTNIAETIQFLVAGKALVERRPKRDLAQAFDIPAAPKP
jgi:phosphate transport system protein